MKQALKFFSTLILVAATAVAAGADGQTTSEALRIGVSHSSFGTLNRNDASAALKAWAATVARERKLQVEVEVDIFDTEADLRRATAQGSLHGLSMTTQEFFRSGEHPKYVYLAVKGGAIAEQYVLLVHREGGVDSLPALRGRRLVRHVSPATSPAMPWLDTLLADQGLELAGQFLGEVSGLDSPSKTILRVFFRQSDACLVSARAFELACELNPQLRRQLTILASSPPLVPGLFFFLNEYTSPQRTEFEAALANLHTSVAGQQVLTVFQSTRMEKHPLSSLDTTRQFFERHARLTGPAGGTLPESRAASAGSQP